MVTTYKGPTYHEAQEEIGIINYQFLALNAKTIINKFVSGEYQGKTLSPLLHRSLDKAKKFIAQIQVGSLKGTPVGYDKQLLPTLETIWVSEYGKRVWENLNEKPDPLEEKINLYLSAIDSVKKQKDLNKKERKTLKELSTFFKGLYDIIERDLNEITLEMSDYCLN